MTSVPIPDKWLSWVLFSESKTYSMTSVVWFPNKLFFWTTLVSKLEIYSTSHDQCTNSWKTLGSFYWTKKKDSMNGVVHSWTIDSYESVLFSESQRNQCSLVLKQMIAKHCKVMILDSCWESLTCMKIYALNIKKNVNKYIFKATFGFQTLTFLHLYKISLFFQDNVSHSALVQLFDPLQSPRCYAVVGIKESTV